MEAKLIGKYLGNTFNIWLIVKNVINACQHHEIIWMLNQMDLQFGK